MYRVIIDTETAGPIDDRNALRVYDFAYCIIDSNFRTVCQKRFLISEVFSDVLLMESAYYAHKLPGYYRELAEKKVTCVKLFDAYQSFINDCKKYKVKQIWAYNASFDRDALNATISAISNGFKRYFFPYGVKVKCIQSLCCSTILNRPSYFKFAQKHGLLTAKGNLSTTAESAFRYYTGNPDFIESHTALNDVLIEKDLLAYALTRKTKGKKTEPKRDAWRIPQKAFKEWAAKQ